MEAKRKTGWHEWADQTKSLYRGCTNGCRYCWARANDLRFGRVATAEEWSKPVLIEREAQRRWGRCQGVIGFPGTHDITPENVEACEKYLIGMLGAGNRVLIDTKPHIVVVARLCQSLRRWRSQVEWRMTMTGHDDRLRSYWEPNAPSILMRRTALWHALQVDYRVSVNMEPMIDGMADVESDARSAVEYGAETVWIGLMNRVRQRVRIETVNDEREVERIETLQKDSEVMNLVANLGDVPQVRWKDSISAVIARYQQGEG